MFNVPADADRLKKLGIIGFRFLEETGSTNDDALAWAEQGAADGSLVVADTQTRGRGRLDRQWVTSPGSALAMSLILRPTPAEAAQAGLFAGLGAVAVAEALEQGWGLKPQIKWPNDVLLGGKKACGILSEAAWSGSHLQTVVLGIGVNVAPSSVPLQEALLFPAICIEAAAGRTVERQDVLERIMERLFFWRPALGSVEFLDAWNRRLAFRGQAVQIVMPGYNINGEVMEVDSAGGLRLCRSDGNVETVLAGDVHLRPAGNGR
ncbi:MAG: biotin--[acetyl-CoA-carboxylase] ligase [Anaerolineaceae bacterium]|nr:biotin--[acetyl-CoA-carboxylase] ligase [Anaerolineaceae bacterium]